MAEKEISERGSAMNLRMRQAREKLNLSQAAFGDGAGVGLGVIKNIDYNRTEPNPLYFDLLCKAYNIDRQWIETGEGEMFRESTQDERIAQFVGKALADKSDRFKVELLDILAGMNEDDWKALKRIADILNGKKDGG